MQSAYDMVEKITNLQILKLAAKKCGYSIGLIDPTYSEAVYVTDGRKHFISRSKTLFGMYPTNYNFSENLVDDKATTKRVLKRFGFRIIKGKKFYFGKIRNGAVIKTADRTSGAYAYARKITYPVFVKPNNGSRGFNAKIIFNQNGLKAHLKTMRKDRVKSFLVEKFTQRPEYRLFIVGGKVQFMYRKKRMSIIGTGEHTVGELIELLTPQPDRTLVRNMLRTHKKTKESVLRHEYELILQETGNISLGAQIIDYREEVPRTVQRWAQRLYEVIGLDVFAVDFFAKGAWNDPSQYLIIEVNSCPALSGIYQKGHHEKTFQIWKLIMQRFFKRT